MLTVGVMIPFYVLMILDVDEYRVVPARQIQRESTCVSEPGTMHSCQTCVGIVRGQNCQ